MRTPRFAVLLVLLTVLASCARNERPADADDYAEQTDEPAAAPVVIDVPVYVTNHNWSDVVIYAVRGSTRSRLGQVTSMAEVRFVLPRQGAGSDIRLLVDPIGSTAYFLTDVLLLSPGVFVSLYVENHLPASSWTVAEEAVDEPDPVPADTTSQSVRR